MCGIVAMIARRASGFFHSDLDLMQNLLLLDQIRGEDSTGMFTVFRDRSVTLTKIGSHPAHLFNTKAWETLRSKSITNGRIMVGHNRKATTGAVNSDNAHPFHENNIVLVHNGTLRGDHKKLAETEVDSHAVCHAFNDQGAEKVIPTLDAAFAFVWWDIEKSKLFAVRNSERPLSLVITEDYNILCSEPWMAIGLVSRAGKKVETVIDLTPGTVFEFSLDGTYTTSKIDLRPQPQYGVYPVRMTGRHSGSHNRDIDGRFISGFNDLEDDDAVGVPQDPKPNGGTTQTPFERAAQQLIANANFVKDDDFKVGEFVSLRIRDVDLDGTTDQFKVTGFVNEPGKPPIDFASYVTKKCTRAEKEEYRNKDVTAKIMGMTRSACGPSLWCRELELAPMVQIHNTDVPERVWTYVLHHSHCKECGKGIHKEDARFTSVSRRPDGLRVICADCIENKLTGAVKDEFTKRRLDALQDGLNVSQKPASSPLVLVKAGNSPTLH